MERNDKQELVRLLNLYQAELVKDNIENLDKSSKRKDGQWAGL